MSESNNLLKQIGRVFLETVIETLEKPDESLTTNVISRAAPITNDIKGDVYDQSNKIVLDSNVSSIGKAAYIGDIYSEKGDTGNLPVLKNGDGYNAQFNGVVGGALSGLIYNYDSARIQLIKNSIANGNDEEFKNARLILDPGHTGALIGTAKYYGDVYSTYYDGSPTDNRANAELLIDSKNKIGNLDITGRASFADIATYAKELKTARNIGGVSFDGSADIDLPGVNTEGNQNTTGNAATADSVPYTGLTGTVPTWNQNTTGKAATADSATYASSDETKGTIDKRLDDLETKSNNNNSTIPGTIIMWSQKELPSDKYWFVCDGSVDNVNDIDIPDLSGKFIVGQDICNSKLNTVGNTGGKQNVTLTTNEMPSHSHGFIFPADDVGEEYDGKQQAVKPGGDNGSWDDTDTNLPSITIKPTGGNGAHENMPPYYVLQYLIYAPGDKNRDDIQTKECPDIDPFNITSTASLYTYNTYSKGGKSPPEGKISDQNIDAGGSIQNGISTQDNYSNGDDSEIGVASRVNANNYNGGNIFGVRNYTFDKISTTEDNNLDKYTFLNYVGISGGGGAGGPGSGTSKTRGGTGQGGGSGCAIIAQIAFDNCIITNIDNQVGGGGAGGTGGGRKDDNSKLGSAAFTGGDTTTSIAYIDSNNISHSLLITLTGGNGGVGGEGAGKGGGNVSGDPKSDAGLLTIVLDEKNIIFNEGLNNVDQNGINITYKYYKGSKGDNGQNNSSGGGAGGKIDNKFYTDIDSYFKDQDDDNLKEISNIINEELTGNNYKFNNPKSGDIITKLGQGGLSASATQASPASNSYSGRGGFTSFTLYTSRPSYMPILS